MGQLLARNVSTQDREMIMTEEKIYELWAYRYGWDDMYMPELIHEGTKKECQEARKNVPSDEYSSTSISEKWIEDE